MKLRSELLCFREISLPAPLLHRKLVLTGLQLHQTGAHISKEGSVLPPSPTTTISQSPVQNTGYVQWKEK